VAFPAIKAAAFVILRGLCSVCGRQGWSQWGVWHGVFAQHAKHTASNFDATDWHTIGANVAACVALTHLRNTT
jgi:hypothetical protein